MTPSQTTQTLINMLLQRDQAGREKYGTTLDRTDLTPEQWAQHAVEESLDRAGYLVRWKQTHDMELHALKTANLALVEKVKRLEGAGDKLSLRVSITRSDDKHNALREVELWQKAKGTQ